MSGKEPRPVVDDPEDEDLSDLLNSALKDFNTEGGKTAQPAKATAPGESSSFALSQRDSGAPNSQLSSPTEEDLFMLDPAQMQKAAADFHNMMRQLAEVQKALVENQESTEGPGSSKDDGAASNADEEGDGEYAKALVQNLNLLADKAQKVSEASSEEHFREALESLHSDEAFESQFLPFIGGFMGTLLSKEMLYPSLSEIREKYPAWLQDNEQNLDAPTASRYKEQLEVIKKICQEYEAERTDDTEAVKEERFHKIVILLQKMQSLGHPPQELAGDLPPGWTLDPGTQMPCVTDSKVAAEACCVM